MAPSSFDIERGGSHVDEHQSKSGKADSCLNTSQRATSVESVAQLNDQSGEVELRSDPAPIAEQGHDGLAGPPRDPADIADSVWSFDRQSRVMVQQLQEQNLPPMSSRSSLMFRSLTVEGAVAGIALHGSMSQVFQTPLLLAKKLTTRGPEVRTTILQSIDGVVREGEMLLVLGRPGSGCSTLLKALAGMTAEYSTWRGDVRYNGVGVDLFKSKFPEDLLYVSDVDTHFPHLHVADTLDFASQVKTPRQRLHGISEKQFVKSMTDVYTTILGLRHTLRTKVGNEYVHGISGGERRRVSIAETFATGASVTCWDNPTRGLDASTSVEFVRIMRTMTTISRKTAVLSLYQASENVTRQFDKVTILFLGHQIFFGSIREAKTYFEDMGFVCQPGLTTADFLTSITDPLATSGRSNGNRRTPRTPEDFVAIWKQSAHYARLQSELQQYEMDFSQVPKQLERYQAHESSLKSKHQRKQSVYMVDLRAQFAANIKRAWHRFIGDKAFLGAMAFSSIFMSLIIGSLFFSVPKSTSGYFSTGGALFFAVLFNALQTMSEIGTLYYQRPIVRRQRMYAMYHPFVEALASMLVEYPYKIINITIFDIVLYFMVGLKRDPGAFFIFWLTTYLGTLTMSAYFRMLASVTNKVESAMALAGVSVLAFAIYAGYMIPKPSMHPWFKWIIYVDPIAYAFEILMVNEFHGALASCAAMIPSGPGYYNASIAYQVCAVTGAEAGQKFVDGDRYLQASYDYHYSHLWRNVGILCAFICGFIIMFTIATELKTTAPNGRSGSLIFRRNHEPESVREVLNGKKRVYDIESKRDDAALTEVKSHFSEVVGMFDRGDVFTWEDICYDISLSDGQLRRLLSHVSGYILPGTLTALMGESGAGKTTLLNVLAARHEVGIVGGEILVRGAPRDRSFRRKTGYVQQQDVHLPQSTIREALRFSAILRQPSHVLLSEKYEYVERVIEMLEMQDFAEAIIGTPGNWLNMERRKRTTIAVELVAKPALLLFLDEPTSGLDSQSAWSIVRLLRKLADSGQAILCTVHQPSSVLFEQFDRLLLLMKGGKPVYFGDIGPYSRTLVEYFESKGAIPCPEGANPAEYILEAIGAGATAQATRDWSEIWMDSAEQRNALDEIQRLKEGKNNLKADDPHNLTSNSGFAVSWWTQYRKVQWRLYSRYWRNPTYLMGKVMLNIVAGLFLGFTFYKGSNSVQGLQNKLFAVFTSAILGFPLMNQLQPQFAELAELYLEREKPSRMYHWTALVMSSLLVEISYNMVAGTLFFFPWYFAIGFSQTWPESANSGARGVYMWLMVMSFEVWLSSFGIAIAALAPSPQVASTLTTLFAAFVVAFNGILQPLSQLTQFWHWMYHLSPYTYLMGGLTSAAIQGTAVECAPKEINYFQPPPGQTCQQYAGRFVTQAAGKILNPDATADCRYCRYTSGDQYLVTRDMDFADHWRNLGLMATYCTFNIGVAFCFFYAAKVATWDRTRLMAFKRKAMNRR